MAFTVLEGRKSSLALEPARAESWRRRHAGQSAETSALHAACAYVPKPASSLVPQTQTKMQALRLTDTHRTHSVLISLSKVSRSVGTPARRGLGIRHATSSAAAKPASLLPVIARPSERYRVFGHDSVVLAHKCRWTLIAPAQHLDPGWCAQNPVTHIAFM